MSKQTEALKMAYKAEETGNLQDLVDAVNMLVEVVEGISKTETTTPTIKESLKVEALKMAIEALEIDEFGFVCKRTHDKRLAALMKCCSALEESEKFETQILLDQVQYGNSIIKIEQR